MLILTSRREAVVFRREKPNWMSTSFSDLDAPDTDTKDSILDTDSDGVRILEVTQPFLA